MGEKKHITNIEYIIKESNFSDDVENILRDISSEGFWPSSDETSTSASSDDASKSVLRCRGFGENGSADLQKIILALLDGVKRMKVMADPTLWVIREQVHIDPVYRDCYYSLYARKHRSTLRFSQRLNFFVGSPDDQFLESSDHEKLAERFVGSVVINPLSTGAIGRTLLDPKYALSSKGVNRKPKSAFVRLSDFKTTMYGIPLNVETFPYRTQDSAMLKCAEVTLINLIEYYSNEYSDYRFVLGSEMHKCEAELLSERTLPASGISYATAARLLTNFGFQSKLHGCTNRRDLKERFDRALYHYVESGIPVAVNVSPKNGNPGHSLLCVGHAGIDPDLVHKITDENYIEIRDVSPRSDYVEKASSSEKETSKLSLWKKAPACRLSFAADFYDHFVVIDDNQMPFSVRSRDELSVHNGMENDIFLVALHRGIMLDATDAEECVIQLLSGKKTGLFNWAGEFMKDPDLGLGENPKVVIRLFLASSRKFKGQRASSQDSLRAQYYRRVPLPHFVWVAELYHVDHYAHLEDHAEGQEQFGAFGEIVLDATFTKDDDINDAVVIWNFPDRFAVRFPEESPVGLTDYKHGNSLRKLFLEPSADSWKGIKPFDGNLKCVKLQ